MIKSMTGYGQASVKGDNFQVRVEIKSVNHRFQEIAIRMPRELASLEETIKKAVGQFIGRGKIDVFISLEKEGGLSGKLSINWSLAEEYYQAYQELKDRFSFDNPALRPIDMMNLSEVLQLTEESQDARHYLEPVLHSVEAACHQLLHMRQSEGINLQEDLSNRVHTISRLVEDVRLRGPVVTQHYRDRLMNRMKEFLAGQWEVDEARLLTEVAIFAEKANIDEELTRLASHCGQFLSSMSSSEPVGRKLDFLFQEMNREANTIGSKANDLEISKLVVDLKAELEKIKEQVQNIE